MTTRQTPTQRRQALARRAAEHLSAVSPSLEPIISRVGPHRLKVTRDPFLTLVGSIIQQQISMSAAASIQRRLTEACPGGRVTPAAIQRLGPARLRKAGLSNQKAGYLVDLARHADAGRLGRRTLSRLDDEEIIVRATEIRGIGRWTAEMLLIFCLERPDVWPIDDLGLRKAVARFTGRDLDKKGIVALAEPWRPFRSYASWYLWRSLEGPKMPGIELRS